MVKINQEGKKRSKDCEQQKSLYRKTQVCTTLRSWLPSWAQTLKPSTPPGSFLCTNHPQLLSCIWVEYLYMDQPSHFKPLNLDPYLPWVVLLSLESHHFLSPPHQANIHTDHTKKHIQQKSGAQPQESTCLGSNVNCKM